jgi:hypothetical protein
MLDRTTARRRALDPAERPNEEAVDRYVRSLKAAYARYARPIDELRQLVDQSMGGASLTAVLYDARVNRRT